MINSINSKEYDEHQCKILNITMEELKYRQNRSYEKLKRYEFEKELKRILKEQNKLFIETNKPCSKCIGKNTLNLGGYSDCLYCDENHTLYREKY